MEDWRRTAESVSVQNLVDINMTIGASGAIDVARARFPLAAMICGRYGQGLPYQPDVGDAIPHLGTAMDAVRFAVLSTRNLSTYHAASRHVFSTAAEHIGLQGTAPWWWQRWEGHHADAAVHADMALQRLRSAWLHGAAYLHAICLMRDSVPLRDAWGPAAEQLLLRATDELAMAKAALEQMRPVVVAKFSDAWMLLSL